MMRVLGRDVSNPWSAMDNEAKKFEEALAQQHKTQQHKASVMQSFWKNNRVLQ